MISTHISQAASLGHDVVDGVTGNPQHGSERHDEADAVRPQRVLHAAVLDRRPTDQVEDEDGLELNGNTIALY